MVGGLIKQIAVLHQIFEVLYIVLCSIGSEFQCLQGRCPLLRQVP